MSSRTILWMLLGFLITQLVADCDGDPHPDDRMWTEPIKPTAGEPFDVFCRHEFNKDQTKVQIYRFDQINNRRDEVSTVRVNDTTVRHSVTSNQPGKFHLFDFVCYIEDEFVGETKSVVAPVLDVNDFVCRFEDENDYLRCTFGHLTDEMNSHYIIYHIAINDADEYGIKCEQSRKDKSQIQCNGYDFFTLYLVNGRDQFSFKLKLVVIFCEERHVQKFNLTLEQIQVPKWTFKVGAISWSVNLACLSFDYDLPDQDPRVYRWRVLLVPLNPRIKQWEAKVQVGVSKKQDICFDYPNYGSQRYVLHLWRRFNKPTSPWTSTYRVFPFVTRATEPDRPPQFLPNGFRHDSEKGELYVYWKPLDELEFGSTGLQYHVFSFRGLEERVLGNHSALIQSWDSTQPATVAILSSNIVGVSVNSSEMEVPVLTNAERRQPQDVWYHIDNSTVTWRPPIDKYQLIGYTLFWCRMSSGTSDACNDLEFIELDGSQILFPFNKCIAFYHTAVAAKYSENISGGMVWSRPKPVWITKNYSIISLVMTVIFVMVLTFGLICLFLTFLRKLRAMSDIPVELPDHLMDSLKRTTDFKPGNLADQQRSQDPVMGNISPKHMEILLGKTVEELLENVSDGEGSTEDPKNEDPEIESTPDFNLLKSSVQYTMMGSTALPENVEYVKLS